MAYLNPQFPLIRFTKILMVWSICATILLAFLGFGAATACGQAFGPVNTIDLGGTNGYVQVANGVYFSGDFTIEGWVFVRSYNGWSRLIDFANGPNSNNVYLALSAGTTGYPTMGVFTNNNSTPVLEAGTRLPTNQWVHLAATLSGTTGTIYINGNPVGTGPLNVAPNVVRTNNYIGRSNYNSDGYANAMFDEVRIWNVALTQAQIQSTMHVSLPAITPGLVAMWRFDEGEGSSTLEAVSGAESELVGGVTWTDSSIPFIPYAVALAPYSLSGSTAELNGDVNAGDLVTTAWVEWGTTTNYGNTTASVNLPALNLNAGVSFIASNLNPATVYHYEIVATNSAGTNFSADYQFWNEPVVTSLADDGSFGSLRSVIGYVDIGETITIATNGTITLTNGEIELNNGLNIIGPGPANLTITGNGSNRVFNIGPYAGVSISGLTISNAMATSSFAGDGGGIYNSGTLTLSNCIISDCTAMTGTNALDGAQLANPGPTGGTGANGGGIYNAGTLSLVACILSGNTGGMGGFGAPQPAPSFYFAGSGGTGGVGGAIYNAGTLQAANCTFSNNSGGLGGIGGLLIFDSGGFNFPIVEGPPGNGGPGGAIYNLGTATLTGCTLSGNVGGPGNTDLPAGGSGAPGNGGSAGAIYNAGGLSLTLCTLDGNAGGTGAIPGDGGGIYNSGSATLTASTITRNSATTGGGIYNASDFGAVSTIFAGNIATTNAPDYYGSFSSEGYNLIGNDSGSFGFFAGFDNDLVGTATAPINPLIAPLANNGGPTITAALEPGSPAIGAGYDGLQSMGVTTDQRGFPRESNGRVDIGAYETTIIGSLSANIYLTVSNKTLILSFSNTPSAVFSVLTSTNLALPMSEWTVLGTPIQISPGQYQFVIPSATNTPQQFFVFRSP